MSLQIRFQSVHFFSQRFDVRKRVSSETFQVGNVVVDFLSILLVFLLSFVECHSRFSSLTSSLYKQLLWGKMATLFKLFRCVASLLLRRILRALSRFLATRQRRRERAEHESAFAVAVFATKTQESNLDAMMMMRRRRRFLAARERCERRIRIRMRRLRIVRSEDDGKREIFYSRVVAFCFFPTLLLLRRKKHSPLG